MSRPKPDRPLPHQRSVWDFPRPPAIEPEPERLRIVLGGVEIAATTRGVRVLETSHPPVYFVPPDDVAPGALVPIVGKTSFCEWKGRARYWDVRAGEGDAARTAPSAAFGYDDPTPRFRDLAGWVSFYAGPMDACFVGDQRAEPQPGGFYSGWVTPGYAGPFKGGPGSMGW